MKTYNYKGYSISHQTIKMGEDNICHWQVCSRTIPSSIVLVYVPTIREAKEWINYRIGLLKS